VSTTMTTPPAYAGAPPHARRGRNVRVFSPPFLRRGGCEAAGWLSLRLCCARCLPAQAQSRCLVLIRNCKLYSALQGQQAEGQGTARGSAAYVGEFPRRQEARPRREDLAVGRSLRGEFAEDSKHGTGIYAWGARSAFAGDRYEAASRTTSATATASISGERRSYAGPWKDDAVAGARRR